VDAAGAAFGVSARIVFLRTVIDPLLLETLPERERRAGLAEVVKTGLLANEPLWELPTLQLVRR